MAAPASLASKPAVTESQGLLRLGAALTGRSDFVAAEIAYRQLLASRDAAPADVKAALRDLAAMHRKQGTFTKAVAIYEKYLQEYPADESSPEVLLDLGRTLRAMGAHKKAIARFYSVINSTLKLTGDGFERYQQLAKTAQFEIAETHFISGNYTEANRFFSRLRLLDLAPGDRARAHFKAGYALFLQSDFEGTVATVRAYLEQWPEDENAAEARYILAVSFRTLMRPQEAAAVTLELLRSEKSREGADRKRWAYWQRRTGNQLANDFFEQGDIQHAHAIYSGLAGLSDDPAWKLPVNYQIALCLERLGRKDRASSMYQTIIEATRSNVPPALLELGTAAAWRLGQLEWHDSVTRQLSAIFETTTGLPAVATAAAKPAETP